MKYKSLNNLIYLLLTSLAGYFLVSCQPSASPNSNYDKKDSVFKEAKKALYSDPDKSQKLLQELLTDQAITDSLEWYKFYNSYVYGHLLKNNIDSAITGIKKTFDFYNKAPEHSKDILIGDAYNCLGTCYAYKGISDSSKKYFNKALIFYKSSESYKAMIKASNNLAATYLRSGEYVKGATQYKKSLLLADSLKLSKDKMITIYNGLAQTYLELRNYELSTRYQKTAYQYYNDMTINQKLIFLSNLGNLYYFQKKDSLALNAFTNGYKLISDSISFDYPKNIFKLNIGEMYMLLGQIDSAKKYIIPSYNYFTYDQNISGNYHAETLILGLALAQKDFDKAAKIISNMRNDYNTDPSLIGIRNKYLEYYYEATGDCNMAFQYLKRNSMLEDSIRNERIKMRVLEMQLRYKNDTTLINQNLFIQKQMNKMKDWEIKASIFIAACIIIILIMLFIYLYQKRQRSIQQIKYRNNITKLRLENIRNRISPHFSFNILSHVLSNFKETDPIYKSLYNLIKIMRMNLLLIEKSCIPLIQELDFVSTYLTLEKERFNNSFQYNINIDPNIDIEKIILPAMIIQIPVENSIKHGLRNKGGEKILNINVSQNDKGTIINIKDNGSGFYHNSNNNHHESTNTGLKIISQTLHLFNANNKDQISFIIRNNTDKNGTVIGCITEIFLPKNYIYKFPNEK